MGSEPEVVHSDSCIWAGDRYHAEVRSTSLSFDAD